jgi:hypothetical protein
MQHKEDIIRLNSKLESDAKEIEMVQKDKQRSTKLTHRTKDRVTQTPLEQSNTKPTRTE